MAALRFAGARAIGLLCIISVTTHISACIFKYGTAPENMAEHAGTAWDHGMTGSDWEGVDGSGRPWICLTGRRQSPINVPSLLSIGDQIPRDHQTRWKYPDLISNGSNIEVINNGHTIQVEWLSEYDAEVKIAVPANANASTRVTDVLRVSDDTNMTHVSATPLQFHFHAVSEHLVDGRYYPLELHIVHRVTDLPACAAGCYTVTGMLFQLSEGDDNPLLEAIWSHMPMHERTINYLPDGAVIPLGKLLPKPYQRDYVTYEGSLTTPPCSEGLLWHVLTKPQNISHAQWNKYRMAVGMKECTAANGTVADDDHHHHHHHHHRRMLAEAAPAEGGHESSSDDYTCTTVAYGYNYRSAQMINGRPVKIARV